MSKRALPIRLNKEPLIDVVCAVNFSSDLPVEALLPGLLLSKLNVQNPKIESLPAAQLPQVVRESDPNLKNAPLMRIMIDDLHFVMLGAKWAAVGCQIPYSGWSNYKSMIVSVFSILCDTGFIKSIDRHSIKYVDFIETNADFSALSLFELKIKIAGRELENEQTQIRSEIIDEHFVHAVNIISKANLNKSGDQVRVGAVVDVDTHRVVSMSAIEFKEGIDGFLEGIHTANKRIFFDLLSERGLERLEPIYA